MTLMDWLAAHFPASTRQTLRRMASAGRVLVNGRIERKMNRKLAETDEVTILDRAAATSHAAPSARVPRQHGQSPDHGHDVEILYEDEDLLVVDKPPGLLTSTVPREKRPTLLAMVREYLTEHDPRADAGLIHRLDRDAGGLLVFSKNEPAYDSLKSQFFHHKVERVYAAVVRGVPKQRAGRIESRLVERADGTVYSTRQHARGDRAVTDYEVIETQSKRSLVRVTLHTGRKHQIRVHLREQGHPIVGDRVYGNAEPPDAQLLLVAARLGFTHPRTREPVRIDRPLPASFGDWQKW